MFSIFLFCIFITNSFVENIFIIIVSIGLWSIKEKISIKDIVKNLLVAYLILNLIIIVFCRENLKLREGDIYSKPKYEKVVLLVFDGEDKKYNLRELSKEIYDEDKFISFFNMTYRLHKFKNMYEKFGYSSFKDKSYILRDNLAKKLGKDYIVLTTNLYTKPYIENTLLSVLDRGYKNIIVCPVLFTEGKDFNFLKKRIKNVQMVRYGAKLQVSDLFWQSDELAKSYKNKILDTIDDKKQDVGVLLVGLENKNNTEEDLLFREKIKKYILDEKGYNINIRLALLENYKKDIVKNGEELFESGIDTLCLAMPTSSFDSIYIKYLAQNIFEKLKIPNEVKFYYIDSLCEEDVFVNEIYKNIKMFEN